jgi:putative Holliday junction resolvase
MLTPDNQPTLPITGRLAGIDFGTARIGVAVCDPSQKWSSPLDIRHCTAWTPEVPLADSDAEYFRQLATDEHLVGWVVGLPLHASGDASEKSEQAVSFGNALSQATDLPINWMDERFTTAAAREILNAGNLSAKKRKAALDKIAAQVILQSFLDSDRSRHHSEQDHALE